VSLELFAKTLYGSRMDKVDVIIVGAGLNGLVAALALGGRQALRPLKVAVLDRFDPSRFATVSHDSRASALTLATQTMFTVLGLWDDVKAQAQNMERIIVTDSQSSTDRPTLLSFGLNEAQKPVAAMVENHHLFRAALALIAKTSNIQIMSGQALANISFGPGLAHIGLDDGTRLKASLIVGADGRNSHTREKAGLKLQGWDYAQSAITLTVAHELPHEGVAEEHFTADGVFAVLPLVGNRSSLVWTETHDKATAIAALSDEDFLVTLQQKFGMHRGKLSLIGARHVYPLSMKLADSIIAPRLALLGDAAHVIHPLAGLGLNLGFKDAAALAECVAEVVAQGSDLGGAAVLKRYEAWRRFDTVSTAYLLDGLNRLFANDVAGLKMLRDMGLKIVDRSTGLKSVFMKEAAGQIGDLPRLMRGLAA
jgi:2-octaprenyl-6-methoxyphenol hydroxylase